jgi:hypothetical protein
MTADPMKNFSIALPFWARAVLLAGLAGIVLGAGLIAYRFYAKPTTLSLAVGSFDGEAAKVAMIVAGRLEATKSSVRVKIVPPERPTSPSCGPMSATFPRREVWRW